MVGPISSVKLQTCSHSCSGPFIGLCRFDPSVIRWCLMHVLHLGLLYVANGGTMHFARAYVIVLFDHHLGVFFLGGQICVSCLVNISWLRNLLLSIGLWGRADEPVQTRLHRAYLAFKTWCATNQISCSQPAFQPKMDSWNKFVFFVVWGWALTIFSCLVAGLSILPLN